MPQKRIAILIHRSASMKLCAPIILEALKRKIKVFLICGSDPENSWNNYPLYKPIKKNLNFPYKEKTKIIYYHNNKELENLIADFKITDVFITTFRKETYGSALRNIKKSSKIYCLQFYGDDAVIQPNLLNQINIFFVYSQEMINVYFRAHPNCNKQKYIKKFIIVGNPILDGLKDIKKNRKNIFRKYNIPESKNIILFMALNLSTSFWRRFVFGTENKIESFLGCIYKKNFLYIKDILFNDVRYKDIIKAIKLWSKKNNSVLVVKTKLKQNDPSFLKKTADIFLTDTTIWYPYRTLELISISNLVIGINSTSVLEAAASGVFNISINIINEFDKNLPTIHFKNSGVYEKEGVAKWPSYKEFPEFLKKHKLTDFKVNSKNRKEYVNKYLGFDDYKASERIIDYVLKN